MVTPSPGPMGFLHFSWKEQVLLTVVDWQNEFSHAGDTGWEFSVENVFCNAKIYSCEMSSFRYLRFFFLFSTRNIKSEKTRVLWIVLPLNGAAAVRQGSCDKTCCVQASGERAAHVGSGKAVY